MLDWRLSVQFSSVRRIKSKDSAMSPFVPGFFRLRAGAPRRPAPSRLRARPSLQLLEGRIAPATLTVTNANDAGPGSLRQAILDTNALPTADTIAFDPTFFATP